MSKSPGSRTVLATLLSDFGRVIEVIEVMCHPVKPRSTASSGNFGRPERSHERLHLPSIPFSSPHNLASHPSSSCAGQHVSRSCYAARYRSSLPRLHVLSEEEDPMRSVRDAAQLKRGTIVHGVELMR